MPADTIVHALRGKLIVSCQASPGDPLDHPDTLTRLAASVLSGGAAGLRAEGARNIAAFRSLTQLPILGITKTLDPEGNVYITPTFAAAQAIAAAGADIIALDCTHRRLSAPEPPPSLIRRIHTELHRPVLADIANLEDALLAQESGADAVATTLCGYTPDTHGFHEVPWHLLSELVAQLKIPVILEGHVTAPEQVRRALHLGAHAVVVGSAITRPQTITARFVAATL